MSDELFSIQLPTHPIVERCTRDMHEKLYRLSDKRYVLDSNGHQTTLSRDEALDWLKNRGMSRAAMFS